MLVSSSASSAIKRYQLGNHFFRILYSNNFGKETVGNTDSSILSCCLFSIAMFVKVLPYACLGFVIWTLYIVEFKTPDCQYVLGFVWKMFHFSLNGIQIRQFLSISKRLLCLINLFLVFIKKGQEKSKKQVIVSKQKKSIDKVPTISMIVITLLLMNHMDFEYQNMLKEHLGFKNTISKLFKIPQLSFKLIDNDTILGLGLGCESENINQGRSYLNINISISDCFFSRNSLCSGNGGVICVDGGSYSMNLTLSMFFNCACSGHGGAIYFKSLNSILRMICAKGCSSGASSWGPFVYLRASQVNQEEYLSVSNCSHTTSGYYSIYLHSGNQRVDNTNSSMNNAYSTSGICIDYPSTFTSSHCTFSNNKVSSDSCVVFWSTSGTISMSYSNIVHNNSPSHYGVVSIGQSGSRKMMYCILHDNQNTLFCVLGGSLEVSHSFISHSGVFSASTAVSTTNNSLTYRITYQIQFFNSLHCIADIPLSTPLRTIEKTPYDSPQPTIEMTKINTPHLTPYRSFGEPDPPQSLFPEHTPPQSLFPEHTPPQSLFPEHTPPQSLFPIHTPYYTQNPERTNQRSFPVDFFERTPSSSNDQSNNLNENKSNSIFMYSTVGMSIIIIVMISYNIGSQMNKNKNESSSSSSLEMEKKHKREDDSKKEKYYPNDSKRDQKMNHHDDYVSSPYVF